MKAGLGRVPPHVAHTVQNAFDLLLLLHAPADPERGPDLLVCFLHPRN